MNVNGQPLKAPDLRDFDERLFHVPWEYKAKYAEQYVAWCPQTMQIVASGPSRDELDEQLEKLGIPYGSIVHDYIEVP